MQSLILFALIAITLSLSGCGTHYVITTKYEMTQKVENPPEIVATTAYKEDAAKIKTVALKAPSNCSNRTTDQLTGKATSQEQVVGTSCAVTMAEIERALTKASYKVISWTVLEREIESFERSVKYNASLEQNLSPLKIAEKLGAQILFQINSLEKSEKSADNIGKNETWDFAYYEADSNGKKIGKKEFDADDREYLNRKFFNRDELLKWVKIPVVTLDASAIQVKSGESIWFYRWTHADFSYVFTQEEFIYCKPPLVCRTDMPDGNSSNASGKASKEGDFFSSTKEQPEDRKKASEFKLLKEVTDNLVSSFSKPI